MLGDRSHCGQAAEPDAVGDSHDRASTNSTGGEEDEIPVLIAWLVAPLASLGAFLSLYFVAATHGWLPPDTGLLPRFCRMDRNTCQRILHTPEARLFGLHNSVLGLAYHGLLLLWLASRPWPALWASALAAAALFTVGGGVRLTWVLRHRLRTDCHLCLAVHAINLVLAIAVVGTIFGRGTSVL